MHIYRIIIGKKKAFRKLKISGKFAVKLHFPSKIFALQIFIYKKLCLPLLIDPYILLLFWVSIRFNWMQNLTMKNSCHFITTIISTKSRGWVLNYIWSREKYLKSFSRLMTLWPIKYWRSLQNSKDRKVLKTF